MLLVYHHASVAGLILTAKEEEREGVGNVSRVEGISFRYRNTTSEREAVKEREGERAEASIAFFFFFSSADFFAQRSCIGSKPTQLSSLLSLFSFR